MKVTLLGTSCGVPTRERGLPSVLIKRNGDAMLFDCGEGTQRQMMRFGVSFMKIDRVFVTHFHGDHYLGLFGLIQSMSFFGREEDLDIYGPRGMIEICETIAEIGNFMPGFEVVGHDISSGHNVEGSGFEVSAAKVRHSVPTLAYVIQEEERPGKFDIDKAKSIGIPEGALYKELQNGKEIQWEGKVVRPREVIGPPRPGRKVVYIGDALPTNEMVSTARDSDLMICEATFCQELADRALETGHSTVKQVCDVARKASVRKLVLTHFSPRYDIEDVREEVSFDKTIIASDGLEIKVPYRYNV